LHALTEATLTSTEVAILKAAATFVGRWSRGIGPGYLEAELNKAKDDPDIKTARRAIDDERANPKISNVSPQAYDYTEKAHKERLAALQKKLGTTLAEKSRLKVSGLKGFDAEKLLSAGPSAAQFMLSLVLADGRRTVKDARNRLHSDSRFVYGADKIITAEKSLLGIQPGSKSVLDQIVDGIVTARLSEKSTWERVWGIIDFLINFIPIPPPAGVILRAIAAGINIGQELDKYAQQSLSYKAGTSSEEPSAGGLAATVFFTAAGSVVDVATSKMLTAERKGLTIGLEEKSTSSAVLHEAEGATAKKVSDPETGPRPTGEAQIAKTAEEVVPAATLRSELDDIARKSSNPREVHRPKDPDSPYDAEMTASDGHGYHRDKQTSTWCRTSPDPCKPVSVPPKVNDNVDEILVREPLPDKVPEHPNLPRSVSSPKNYKVQDVADYYRQHRAKYPEDVQSLIDQISAAKPTRASVERVDKAIKDLHTAEANRMAGYANKAEKPFINSVKGASNEGGEFSSLVTDQKQLTLVGQLKGGRGTAEFDSVQFQQSRIIETKMNLDRSTQAQVRAQMMRRVSFARDWNFSQVQWEVWDHVSYLKAKIAKRWLDRVHPDLAARVEIVNPAQSH